MTCYSAPRQVPFAPRPQPDEVITSWLMRVAAANAVSLSELLGGFEEHHPETLGARSNLAFCDAALGEVATARAEFQALRATILRLAGPDHPMLQTLDTNLTALRLLVTRTR